MLTTLFYETKQARKTELHSNSVHKYMNLVDTFSKKKSPFPSAFHQTVHQIHAIFGMRTLSEEDGKVTERNSSNEHTSPKKCDSMVFADAYKKQNT